MAALSCESTSEVDGSEFYISGEFLYLDFTSQNTTEGYQKSVAVVSTGAWEVTPQQEWIACSIINSYTFQVTLSSNPSSQSREGSIEVTSGGQSITIVVHQDGNLYVDLGVVDAYYLIADARTFYINAATSVSSPEKIRAKVTYSDTEQTGWVTVTNCDRYEDVGNGVTEMTFQIDLTEHESEEYAREATVSIYYSEADGAAGSEFTITQDANPVIILSTDQDHTVDYYDTSTEIEIASNYPLVVNWSEDCQWLASCEESELGYILTMEENTTSADRSVEITFSIDGASTTQVVTLTQKAKVPTVKITNKSNYTSALPYTSGSLNFVVESNIEPTLTIESGKEWVNSATFEVEDNPDLEGDDKIYTYTLRVERNDGELRDCKLTFSYNAEVYDDVTIIQGEESGYIAIDSKSTFDSNFSYAATTNIELTLRTNLESVYVAPLTSDWLTISLSNTPEADQDDVYTFIYKIELKENCSVDATLRSESVVFSCVDDSTIRDSVVISQEAKIASAEVLNKTSIESEEYYFGANSVEVVVRSNVEVVASYLDVTDQTYYSKTLVDGETYDYTFAINLTVNDDFENQKSTEVTFSNSQCNLTESVTLTQAVSPTSVTIVCDTSTAVATVIANMISAGELEENLSIYKRVVVTGRDLTSADFTSLIDTFVGVQYLDISQSLTTTITASKFAGNTTIKEVLFPSTLTLINNSAFNGSALERLVLPKTIESFGTSVFASTKSLKYLELEEGLTTLGFSMFNGSAIESVRIPTSITTWNTNSSGYNYAFQGSALTSVELPEGLTSMGARTFYDNVLESVVIPSTITDWGVDTSGVSAAFRGINDAVTGLKLKSITFADGLKSMPAGMFQYCAEDAVVTSLSQEPPVITNPFTASSTEYYCVLYSNRKSISIRVPAESVEQYQAANGWSDNTIIAIE